jgi:hypothetical protein
MARQPGFHSRQRSLVYSVQAGSGTHPASYPMRQASSFPAAKLTVHLHLLCDQEWWIYTSTPTRLHGEVLVAKFYSVYGKIIDEMERI